MPDADVLVVDDDEKICRAFRKALQSQGYSVTTATSIKRARAIAEAHHFDVALVDKLFSEHDEKCRDGVDFLKELITRFPTRGVLVTGYSDSSTAVRTFPFHVLPKPVRVDDLFDMVRFLCEKNTRTVAEFCANIKLSARESECLHCGYRGLTHKATADVLGVKEATVRSTWRNILRKSHFASRHEVIAALARWEPLFCKDESGPKARP
jgi:DNA-binding NarL/FixJ family response regulator